MLARKPEEITVRQILLAAEGDLTLVICAKEDNDESKGKGKCEFDSRCVTQQVWAEATRQLSAYFDSVTLKDLCEQGKIMGLEKELDHRFMYYI
jgi:DNA-binding IscR family transcriptional regulator